MSSLPRFSHHALRCSSMRSCACSPTGRGRQLRDRVAHEGDPSASHSPAHCSSVATAIATQLSRRPNSSTSAAAVEVLRRRRRSPIARPLQQRPVRGVFDDLFGGDVERGIDHRGLDQHALAGAAAVLQRQQQRVDRMHAGVRVADRVRLVGIAVRIAGQPAHAGRGLDDVGERRDCRATARPGRTRASAA